MSARRSALMMSVLAPASSSTLFSRTLFPNVKVKPIAPAKTSLETVAGFEPEIYLAQVSIFFSNRA